MSAEKRRITKMQFTEDRLIKDSCDGKISMRGCFRLLDDDFMSKVFEDTECAAFLLQIILNRDDLKVKKANSQYSIKNLQGRSV